MGWPKKGALRLYYERKGKSYMVVDHSAACPSGNLECVGELLIDNDPQRPMLCSSSASPGYLYSRCRRASWDEMPPIWQQALGNYLEGTPQDHRGLWRMEALEKS